MASSRVSSSAGIPTPLGRGGPPDSFDPEALERRRFERDRVLAVMVLVSLVVPLAVFAATDALIYGTDWQRLTISWVLRATAVSGLAATGVLLSRASSRARFERILFIALNAGVVISVVTHLGRPRDSTLPTRFELLCVIGFYVAIPLRTRLQVIPALGLSAASLGLVFFWHTGVSTPELLSQSVCFALANVLGVLVAMRRHDADREEDTAWRAVTLAHGTLQRTVRELRALRSVVPICPACRKVRGAREAWQQLEAFVAERGDVEFSQILCPACLQAEFGAVVVTPEPGR